MEKDSLTDLYNKAATQKHVQELLSKNPNDSFAFFFLDIDEFKKVNDTYDHITGDKAISDFAKILKSQFIANGIAGRIGGDEFVVFLAVPSREWTDKKAQSLMSALRHDFITGNQICRITPSIGIAIAPQAGKDFETLYHNADIALYQTKHKGKNGFTIYE